MNRTAEQQSSAAGLAFWGYTNARGATAALALARQLRACEAALDGRAEINRFFYETSKPISNLMMLAVRGAGGPSRWDGSWDQLADLLPAEGRGFNAIICASLDRIGRNTMRLLGLERLVAKYGATILCADEPSLEFSESPTRPLDRMRRRFVAALGDYNCATACALRTRIRMSRDGD